MRIRTITAGARIDLDHAEKQIEKLSEFLLSARDGFENSGIDVQTLRISTQRWEDMPLDRMKAGVPDTMAELEGIVKDNYVDFLSVGPATNPNSINLVPSIIEATTRTCCSAMIASSGGGIFEQNIEAASTSVREISRIAKNGSKNFMFASIASCPADTPFFPASYHESETPMFSIGLESGDLVHEAANRSRDLGHFALSLHRLHSMKLKEIEKTALSMRGELEFAGIDLSYTPGLDEGYSIALAIDRLIGAPFGSQGTLSACAAITSSLKDIDVRRCGYSGLMLPVMEDMGLARGTEIGAFDIQKILLYSSVCGTGLDVVPIPGDTPHSKLAAVLRDVAYMSVRLGKPLSARILPIPERGAGDMTEMDSPHLLDCSILGLI